MKVKALSRPKSTTIRSTNRDIRHEHVNLDPLSHPQSRSREYVRAVTSAKLDRMFAKPFVGELRGGHADAVSVLAACRSSLCPIATGCVDGSIRIWDLANRRLVASLDGAHSRGVTGMVFGNGGADHGGVYSCGEDGVVRSWSVFPRGGGGAYSSSASSGGGDDDGDEGEDDDGGYGEKKKPRAGKATNARYAAEGSPSPSSSSSSPHGPINVYRLPTSRNDNKYTANNVAFHSIDHHWSEPRFATSSSDASVRVWDPERSAPTSTFDDLWGSDDTVTVVRYNPSERDLLAHCSSDRGIGLHDARTSSPLKKTIMSMRSNCLEWNPMEPYVFAVGNEDHQCYTFDMRKMHRPTGIYRGHVGAVMSLSWSPTGTEFATGSYDKTMRIFSVRKDSGSGGGPTSSGSSRDVYHTKRMQRVFCVGYTSDHKYVLSGSDDTNVRLWKARASEKIGQLSAREETSLRYRDALVAKYAHLPEVKRIHGGRRVPKMIKKGTQAIVVQKEKRRRVEGNVVKHSRPGTTKFTDDKAKAIVRTVD